MVNNELWHYGIKGQKWGVRRYQNPDGTLTAAGKRRAAKEENRKIREERKEARNNRRLMTDEELAARVRRLEQEKKLKTLTDEDISAGESAVKSFLKSTGTRILSAAAVGAAAYAGHYLLSGKQFNPQTAANYIFPNPNKKK